jgi:hypothetical protein
MDGMAIQCEATKGIDWSVEKRTARVMLRVAISHTPIKVFAKSVGVPYGHMRWLLNRSPGVNFKTIRNRLHRKTGIPKIALLFLDRPVHVVLRDFRDDSKPVPILVPKTVPENVSNRHL